MLFQTLDDKKNCLGLYHNRTLVKGAAPDATMTRTWTAAQFLEDMDVEYAYLYCQRNLADSCPSEIRKQYEESISFLRAFLRSMENARVDLTQHCFYDLVPEHFLVMYCESKNKICEYVFENYERPKNYDFLRDLLFVTQAMSHRKLNLDYAKAARDCASFSLRNKFKSVRRSSPYVRYNIFGTKTGRMTSEPHSFPILTLNKEFRKVIRPNNDKFVELDFNAFELRVLLYLLDKEQPQIDIHEWNVANVYKGIPTRDEAKRRIFAWLYNLDSSDYLSERAYDRQQILSKYWNGMEIVNPFGRTIESDKFHAISYLVQSTAVDIVLRQVIKLHGMLENKKSYIAFTIHDSVVIDMAEEDMSLLPELERQFSTFRDTEFLTNVSIGNNFGNMEERK
tara:strand:+ start:6092 stop:7276 length:1185 start_codon:yes stop_codon:yes gene_type:complete